MNDPEPRPGVTGNFRQNGRELDGARFALISGQVRAAVYCPNLHQMRVTTVSVPARAVCEDAECPFVGIVYKVHWPSVTLEALQDSE